MEKWPESYKLAGALGFKFPYFIKTPLNDVVPQASINGVNLIDELLEWNPAFRPTSQAALKHQYFLIGQYNNHQPSRQIQLNSALSHTNGVFKNITMDQHQEDSQLYPHRQPQIQLQANGRSLLKQLNNGMPAMQQNMQPSVQINIQSLIKPMETPEKPRVQAAPIVYSFGQSHLGSKYLPVFNNISSRTLQNKKLTWGMENNFEYEDDFADILGSKLKLPSTEMSKETKMNLSQFNLQDILEPLAKASAGNTRNQYLNVSRFIGNQSSQLRRDSNMSLFSNFSTNGSAVQNKNKKTGKADLPNLWTDFGDLSSARRRLGNLNVTNPNGYDLIAK